MEAAPRNTQEVVLLQMSSETKTLGYVGTVMTGRSRPGAQGSLYLPPTCGAFRAPASTLSEPGFQRSIVWWWVLSQAAWVRVLPADCQACVPCGSGVGTQHSPCLSMPEPCLLTGTGPVGRDGEVAEKGAAAVLWGPSRAVHLLSTVQRALGTGGKG